MSLGFLLTDEFFALVSHYDRETFNRWYALGVGLTFYIAWNLFTLAGIVLGKAFPASINWAWSFPSLRRLSR